MIVEVVRSGFVESFHRAKVVTVTADGRFTGDNAVISPRSCNKPLQAAGMVRAGLGLEGELLALAAASHAAEDFHVEGVLKILADAGLNEGALQCPPVPTRREMNCSGKHAAMLATCVLNGWPVESYRDPGHPLQRAIRVAVEELAGEPVAAVGVDGCGAPLFSLSMYGVARAFRAMVTAPPGSPERRVADAMRAHPEWTSGTRRPERELMAAVPGLLNKAGAEAVDAFAHPDGRAGVIKIEDGTQRARVPATVAALRDLGFDPPARLATAPVLGGGEPVGEIRVRP